MAVITAKFTSLCILFLIVLIHEMGHAICARFFSWRIKSIQLLPFGGMAEMEEHGNRPVKEELLVILSGPLQHLWMQMAGWFAHEAGLINEPIYRMFVFYNLSIFFFNLLPIWPLDGGKLLFILLSKQKAYSAAHREMLLLSIAAFCGFLIISLLLNPLQLNGWMMAGFILYSIYREHKHRQFVYIRFLMERYYGKNGHELSSLKPIVASKNEPIYQVLLRFQRGCKHPIIVEENGKKLFQLDENELLHSFFSEKRTNETIGDLQYVY